MDTRGPHNAETPWGLVANAPSPLAVTDEHGVFLGANRAFCSLLGRAEAEVVGSDVASVLEPDDVAEDEALTRRLVAGEAESCRAEQRYRTAHGDVAAVGCQLWLAAGGGDGSASAHHVVRLLRPLGPEASAVATQAAAAVASNPEAITAFSMDGTVIQWNPAAAGLYQLPAERVVGRRAHDVLPSEWADDVDEILRRVTGGRMDDLEMTRPLGDGTSVEVSLTVAPIVGRHDEVAGAAVVARDITRRKRAESLLAGQALILEMIASGGDLGAVLDALGKLVEQHARGTRCSILLFGGESPRRLVHGGGLRLPCIDDLVQEDLDHSLLGGPHGAAAMIVAGLFTEPGCEPCRDLALGLGLRACWASPIVASDSGRILGVFALYYTEARSPNDDNWALLGRLAHVAALAIARHVTMHELAHQAIHDPLTGCANRTLVRDRLAHALHRLKRERCSLAVLFLDLDRFKTLNDSYGHEAGDKVLVELARRLHVAVRPTDTVARLGGDEFVVLCEGIVGELEVVGIADRIAGAVSLPFVVEDKEVPLTASIGIALPRGGDTPESLLDQADAAMYQAKERGKARYQIFDTAMHDRALGRLQTERELRAALEHGELELVYQPLVELEREQVVAVEALLRWRHPQRGLLGPAEFLDVAEDSGLIVPIGAWVIEEACRQAAEWERAAPAARQLTVHVNVSGRQLCLRNLPDVVRRALAGSGATPSTICLEITETVVMRDAPAALRVLQTLKSLGVRLSIDDFGTGYSSLAYVDSFPIDELKIDRSFVTDVRKDEEPAIVHAVVGLAHALDLSVVAEGVERVDQADQLRRMGCDTGQGFYWSGPLLPEAVSALR